MDKIFSKVFIWLSVGLLISFGIGYGISTSTFMVEKIFVNHLILIIILELVVAFVFGMFINKFSKGVCIALYILYSILTGLTLSSIFLTFKLSSIITTFLVASIVFILLSIYGYVTKKDVTKIGTILLFGLIGEIVLILLNTLIFKSSGLDILLSGISLMIFMGYIIYDIHILKRKMLNVEEEKLALYGAFQLYLDFINVFIDLLRMFGESRD